MLQHGDRSTPMEPTGTRAAWWAMPIDQVAQTLDVDMDVGLAADAVAARQARHGANELPRDAGPSLVRRLIAQFADPLVALLVGAIVVSLLAWWSEGADSAPIEAIVIAVIVVANAVIGVWQEGRAINAVAALQRLAAAHTTVVRAGRTIRVPTRALVPGDVVVLVEGDTVGFDGRLCESASLEVNEAPITGESLPVSKDSGILSGETGVADRVNMVLSGTSVVRGRGRAVVVGTRHDTEVGRIATLLNSATMERTPLQRQVDQLGRVLGWVVLGLAVVVIAAIMVTSDVDTADEALETLLVAVSLAVAAVPEGLPAILTVVLALGVQRMSNRNAIVKRLLSVETLGSASVICTDKTGTLTRNEMTVVSVTTASGRATFTGAGYEPNGVLETDEPDVVPDVEAVLWAAAAATDATLEATDDGWDVSGDPTEIALLVAETKLGLTARRQQAVDRLDEVPFDAARKTMSVLADVVAENPVASGIVQFTKGAPDVLVPRCVSERRRGVTRLLTEHRRTAIRAEIDACAEQGLRTLAVTCRRYKRPPDGFNEANENELEWLGLVAIADPPRTEAAEVIARAASAGIRTVMLTGDHPKTASAIGSTLGLAKTGATVSGAELAAVDWSDHPDVDRLTESTDVFARVAPEHKLDLVRAFQRRGHIVAMTGDGVNDAPALRQADIGVAMGRIGTDVAREAADMILTDDDFGSIVAAIDEGRSIFADIRKFLRYLLASNSGEVLVMVIGVLAAGALGLRVGDGLAVPLLATQILWINLLTDSALALALGVDPSVEDEMGRPPRQLTDPIVDRSMWVTIALVGFTTALAGLVALDLELAGGLLGGDGDLTTARTMLFTTVVLAQVFNAFNSRSDIVSAFSQLFANRLLWAATFVTIAMQVVVVHVGAMNRAFETVPLGIGQWLTCAALASSVLVADEIRKVVARARRRRPR